jgi:hypothetical protein
LYSKIPSEAGIAFDKVGAKWADSRSTKGTDSVQNCVRYAVLGACKIRNAGWYIVDADSAEKAEKESADE